MRKPGTHIEIRCPDCGTLGEFGGEVRPELQILCSKCRRDLTARYRTKWREAVALIMHLRLVEQDNGPFLRTLAARWPDRKD